MLSGFYSYGCDVPDPELAARLPHWKFHNDDIKIYLTGEAGLARAIAAPKQNAALLSGKLPEVRGHISIIVDDFRTMIECDSASYSARFVAIAKPPQPVKKMPDGNYGSP